MGNNVTYKPKKATFVVVQAKTAKQERVFAPVNKRAKFVAKKLGVRTKITASALKATKGAGTYKFYFYDPKDGALKPIRF